jgi:hypothetical protein
MFERKWLKKLTPLFKYTLHNLHMYNTTYMSVDVIFEMIKVSGQFNPQNGPFKLC